MMNYAMDFPIKICRFVALDGKQQKVKNEHTQLSLLWPRQNSIQLGQVTPHEYYKFSTVQSLKRFKAYIDHIDFYSGYLFFVAESSKLTSGEYRCLTKSQYWSDQIEFFYYF